MGCYRDTGYEKSELKPSLMCWFKSNGWSKISSIDTDAGKLLYLLNVAKNRVTE